ncbi:MAG: nucleotide exchange factor GrpE [Lentisphaerae bacterium]|jgi:molecular chaperone GrpE|nr:nucleotide exchange factor GrpE [Lentisphaerota bacterium]
MKKKFAKIHDKTKAEEPGKIEILTDEPAEEPENEPVAEPTPESLEAAAPTAETEAPEPLQHQLLRLQADFDNFRKRTAREKQEWIQFASEQLARDILPVLDHFELGLSDSQKNGAGSAFVEGFQLIYNQFRTALEKNGIVGMEPEGELFDPNFHEAMTYMPSDTVPEGHVVTQTRRGYKIGAKLLRAAQVIVSSGPAAE